MRWKLLDTYGLDDVLVSLSKGREVYAQEGLRNSVCRKCRTSYKHVCSEVNTGFSSELGLNSISCPYLGIHICLKVSVSSSCQDDQERSSNQN